MDNRYELNIQDQLDYEIRVLLNAALNVSLGPLHPSWVSLELESVLPSLTISEPHH